MSTGIASSGLSDVLIGYNMATTETLMLSASGAVLVLVSEGELVLEGSWWRRERKQRCSFSRCDNKCERQLKIIPTPPFSFRARPLPARHQLVPGGHVGISCQVGSR